MHVHKQDLHASPGPCPLSAAPCSTYMHILTICTYTYIYIYYMYISYICIHKCMYTNRTCISWSLPSFCSSL